MECSHTITNLQEKQDLISPAKTPSFPPSTPSTPPSFPVTERRHMFEKVMTPSDVGKLNRLVIPKQHAERHFPLDPASSNNGGGGLLLDFEEEGTGRSWRFRYSYWSSSQSYVMTKGLSGFVKDKCLEPGDVVSFSRTRDGRLFIDWRRRSVPSTPLSQSRTPLHQESAVQMEHGILESLPAVVHRSSIEPQRQVRLFGVDLEGSKEEEPPSPLQWGLSAARKL